MRRYVCNCVRLWMFLRLGFQVRFRYVLIMAVDTSVGVIVDSMSSAVVVDDAATIAVWVVLTACAVLSTQVWVCMWCLVHIIVT